MFVKNLFVNFCKNLAVRRPGIEPGSTAWKATMLTITPPTPCEAIVMFSFLSGAHPIRNFSFDLICLLSIVVTIGMRSHSKFQLNLNC